MSFECTATLDNKNWMTTNWEIQKKNYLKKKRRKVDFIPVDGPEQIRRNFSCARLRRWCTATDRWGRWIRSVPVADYSWVSAEVRHRLWHENPPSAREGTTQADHHPILIADSIGCPNSWPVIGDGPRGNIRRNNHHQNKWREMNLTDQTFYGGAKLVTGRNCSFIRHSAQLWLIDCWTLWLIIFFFFAKFITANWIADWTKLGGKHRRLSSFTTWRFAWFVDLFSPFLPATYQSWRTQVALYCRPE